MLSRAMLQAIGDAVERAGGDMRDVEDLVHAWERLERATQARADGMRYDAQYIRCCCADGGLPSDDGRCSRCYGRFASRGQA